MTAILNPQRAAAWTSCKADSDATIAAAEWYACLHAEEVTPDDRLAFARWEAADPANAQAWKIISRVSTELDRETADREDPAFQALRAAVRRRMATCHPRFRIVAAGVTAIAIIAAGATAVGLAANARGQSAVVDGVDHVTAAVGRRDIRLPDGTMVTLDARSAIRVAASGPTRSVVLTHGRAFFTVVHRPERPFVVLAGGNRVTALGTRFAVRITPRRFAVDLMEGRVRVAMPAIRRTTILTAGNRLTVRDGSLRIDTTGATRAVAWRQGPLTGD